MNLLATGAVELPSGCLITPHPGEAARLLKCSVGEVQADRPAAARALAQRYGCVALLKAGTLVAAPDGRLALCDRGHPAMAVRRARRRAGWSARCLAGAAAGAVSRRCSAWAPRLHAAAGERLGLLGRGLAASDLIPVIRQLFEEQSPCLK